MKVSEFFDNKKRASAAAVEALELHQSTWPAVAQAFERLDRECVPIAREVLELRESRSPRLMEAEGRLKLARWSRDRVKQDYSVRLAELRRAAEVFVREPIHSFHCDSIERIRNLSALYKYVRLEPSHNIEGRRLRYGVKISHNTEALGKFRDRILEAIREIDAMQYRSLADVERRISEIKTEFFNYDHSTMQIEEVSEQCAKDMAPRPPDTTPPQMGTLMDGRVYLHHPAATAQIARLTDRLDKLEKNA